MIAEDIKINSFMMQSDEDEIGEEEKKVKKEEMGEDDDLFSIPGDDNILEDGDAIDDKEGEGDEENLEQ